MTAQVVLVTGACGGVGATTLAALLARARTAVGRTALVDLDVSGGAVEVALGLEDAAGLRWADLRHVRGRLDPRELDGMLPRWSGVDVLGQDRRGSAGSGAADVDPVGAGAVIGALVAAYDSVVVDVPGHRLLHPEVRANLLRPLGERVVWVVLTGQDVRGVAAALPLRPILPPGTTAGLVLRHRGRARVAPAEVAHLLGLPLVATVRHHRRVAEAVDRGFGPVVGARGGLGRAVARVDGWLGAGPSGSPRSAPVRAGVDRSRRASRTRA